MSNLFTTVSVEQQEIVSGGIGDVQVALNLSNQVPVAIAGFGGRATAIANNDQDNDVTNVTRITRITSIRRGGR
jgi:hypothetical protein